MVCYCFLIGFTLCLSIVVCPNNYWTTMSNCLFVQWKHSWTTIFNCCFILKTNVSNLCWPVKTKQSKPNKNLSKTCWNASKTYQHLKKTIKYLLQTYYIPTQNLLKTYQNLCTTFILRLPLPRLSTSPLPLDAFLLVVLGFQ